MEILRLPPFWRGKNSGTIQYSKQPLKDEINNAQQKNDNGNFIDTMHYPGVDIGRLIRPLFAKEIACYLAQGEELFYPHLFLPARVVCMFILILHAIFLFPQIP